MFYLFLSLLQVQCCVTQPVHVGMCLLQSGICQDATLCQNTDQTWMMSMTQCVGGVFSSFWKVLSLFILLSSLWMITWLDAFSLIHKHLTTDPTEVWHLKQTVRPKDKHHLLTITSFETCFFFFSRTQRRSFLKL